MNVVVDIVVVVQPTFEDDVKHIRYHLTNTDHLQAQLHVWRRLSAFWETTGAVSLKPMADGPSFLYEKLVRESWYKKFVRVS